MDLDEILFEIEEKMETALDYMGREFRGIRTGRASPGLVEYIKVDYYGELTELRKLAAISTPDANLILVKPFDPQSVKDIDRAIQASDLGITPNSDGKVIRLAVPPLSTERRGQLAGFLDGLAEDGHTRSQRRLIRQLVQPAFAMAQPSGLTHAGNHQHGR